VAWLALEFSVRGVDVDILSDALFNAGAISVDVKDADEGSTEEQAIYLEPGEDAALSWGHNIVLGLFDKDAMVDQIFSIVTDAVAPLTLSKPLENWIDDQDWVRLTQQQFEPIRISKKLRISPSWSDVTDSAEIDIVLDPGLAFGTGSHPTTQLCLRWLEENITRRDSIIDYGCGSGVLGIAARKYGAGKVVCIDIDEDSLVATRYNSERNKVDLEVRSAERGYHIPGDVVIANILPSPLKVLAPLLSRLVKPGGKIVLSGILEDQSQGLIDLYSQWFDISKFQSMDDWVCLQGTKLA
jgi:ribosomal protein L11 methyltransferase